MFSVVNNAQQDANYTHYMFNSLSVNPAYAGTSEMLTITGLHRSQWVAFPGAPRSQTITLHTPAFNNQLGLGLSVINDKIGPTSSTSVYGDVNYPLKINEKVNLGIGVKFGINTFVGDFQSLVIEQGGDGIFEENLTTQMVPNFGFGLYLDGQEYFVGLSSPNLLQHDFTRTNNDGEVTQYSQQRHFFLNAGVVMEMNPKVKFIPTSLLKITAGTPIELDVTSRFLFNEKYWLGAMYRTGDALGILAGIQINQQFAVGYSFDFSFTNKTFKYNNGSHELMLRYDFEYSKRTKIRSPRYF